MGPEYQTKQQKKKEVEHIANVMMMKKTVFGCLLALPTVITIYLDKYMCGK